MTGLWSIVRYDEERGHVYLHQDGTDIVLPIEMLPQRVTDRRLVPPFGRVVIDIREEE